MTVVKIYQVRWSDKYRRDKQHLFLTFDGFTSRRHRTNLFNIMKCVTSYRNSYLYDVDERSYTYLECFYSNPFPSISDFSYMIY